MAEWASVGTISCVSIRTLFLTDLDNHPLPAPIGHGLRRESLLTFEGWTAFPARNMDAQQSFFLLRHQDHKWLALFGGTGAQCLGGCPSRSDQITAFNFISLKSLWKTLPHFLHTPHNSALWIYLSLYLSSLSCPLHLSHLTHVSLISLLYL